MGDRASRLRAAAACGAGHLAVIVLWAVLLTSAFVRLNDLGVADSAALWLFWTAIYALTTAPAAVGTSVAAAGGLRRAGPAAVLGAGGAVATLVVLNLLARWSPALKSLSLGQLTPMGALDLGGIAAGGALTLAAAWWIARARDQDRSPRVGAGLIAAAAAGTALLHGANRLHERPTRVDPATAVAPHLTTATCPRGPVDRVLVLALDGLTWNVAAPLIGAGQLPHLARLLARSSYGLLDTVEPSYSPAVWASVATGLPPEAHGIVGFRAHRFPGVTTPILRGPHLSAMRWWGAADEIVSRLQYGLVGAEPVPIGARRGLALWDVATAHGVRVGVWDWMTTWPGARVDGYLVTGETSLQPDVTWPPGLSAAWEDTPEPAHHDRLAPSARPHARSFFRAHLTWLAEQPALGLVFNKVVDNAHDQWRGGARWLVPERRPTTRFAAPVLRAWELADHWIGRFTDDLPPDTVLIVASDHGFEFNGTNHAFAPPGMIVLSGPSVRCGHVLPRAHVLDLAPTVLALLGLPGTVDMPGEVLSDAFVEAPALRRLDAWPQGWRTPELPAEAPPDADALSDQLRAMGYVH